MSRGKLLAALLASAAMLVSCMANPGPPPLGEETPVAAETTGHSASSPAPVSPSSGTNGASGTSTTSASSKPTTPPNTATKRTQVSVGVDRLVNGLNPHLVVNNSELVTQIADLVLPSAFTAGAMDTNVLNSAAEVTAPTGVAMRVRYEISPAAQWSDGTPVSGADFTYLWRGMVTTPGVNSPAGYRAIAGINTSADGRIVLVDFATRVDHWQLLFAHLLPAHLLGDEKFETALGAGIPASAGRFLVAGVDRARGVITLNRNDRFWGPKPAKVDIIYLREVSRAREGVAMLRAGQIGFLDVTPQQTTLEELSLLPGVSAQEAGGARQLRLHLAMNNESARRELGGIIDTAQIARLATGRTDLLRVPYGGTPEPTTDTAALRALNRPVTIAADPTDDVATAAATVIADQLRAQGLTAKVTKERLSTVTGELLPQGAVDAVITWEDSALTPFTMANQFLCPGVPIPAPTGADSSASATLIPAPWAGGLSAWCPPETTALRQQILAGKLTPEQALGEVRVRNHEHHLYVPLLDETRVQALGQGIGGADVHRGLAGAADWEMK